LEGAKAYQDKRFADAVELFLEADALAPSAALSFNIARAFEGIGDSSATLRWYRDYLRRAGHPEDADAVRAIIDDLEERLQKKGVQQVTVLTEPRGATVWIDATARGVSPWTGDLAPGNHRLNVRLRGYADSEREFTLAADRSMDVALRLIPATEKTATPPPSTPGESTAPSLAAPAPSRAEPDAAPASEGTSLAPLGWIALGAGTAALGGAVVFEVLRRGAESDAESEKTQTGFADEVDAMESRRTVARVLAGVGGALALTGGVLLAIDAGLFSGSSSTEVGLACGGVGCNATARGRF
jgi:hypothetical protein